MKQTALYSNGEFVGSFTVTGKKKRESLKTIINRRKRAKRDARLVRLLTR